MATKKEFNRTLIFIVGGIFSTLWVLVNSQEFFVASLIYIVMGILGFLFYLKNNWENF